MVVLLVVKLHIYHASLDIVLTKMIIHKKPRNGFEQKPDILIFISYVKGKTYVAGSKAIGESIIISNSIAYISICLA